MNDLAMNLETNDLDIVNGDLYLATGSDGIAQDLQQTLQFWLGEWFLDTTFGIPFKQQILIKNPNIDIVQADIINAAAGVSGVTQILDVSFNYSNTNRTFSVSMVAQTSNGQSVEVQAQITLPVNATIEGTVYP
jgi:hypothetical protein